MAATEPSGGSAGGSLVPAAMFVVLTLGLLGATAGCLVVVGLALALWPPALIVAILDGALLDRGPVLAGTLAAPLAIAWLLDRAWRAFAGARTGRCAEYMLAALVASLALHAFLMGAPTA